MGGGIIKKWIFSSLSGEDQIMKSHHNFMKPHSLSLIDTLIHINDDTRPSECCSVNRHHQYLKWLHIRDTLNRWWILGAWKHIKIFATRLTRPSRIALPCPGNISSVVITQIIILAECHLSPLARPDVSSSPGDNRSGRLSVKSYM